MAEVDNSAMFQLLGSIAADIRDIKSTLLQHDRQFTELRETIGAYHSSVVGQGVLMSELDERLSKAEKRIDSQSAAE